LHCYKHAFAARSIVLVPAIATNVLAEVIMLLFVLLPHLLRLLPPLPPPPPPLLLLLLLQLHSATIFWVCDIGWYPSCCGWCYAGLSQSGIF
jgi:hypothetical protein